MQKKTESAELEPWTPIVHATVVPQSTRTHRVKVATETVTTVLGAGVRVIRLDDAVVTYSIRRVMAASVDRKDAAE